MTKMLHLLYYDLDENKIKYKKTSLMQGLTSQNDIHKFVEENMREREVFRRERLGIQDAEVNYDREELGRFWKYLFNKKI